MASFGIFRYWNLFGDWILFQVVEGFFQPNPKHHMYRNQSNLTHGGLDLNVSSFVKNVISSIIYGIFFQ